MHQCRWYPITQPIETIDFIGVQFQKEQASRQKLSGYVPDEIPAQNQHLKVFKLVYEPVDAGDLKRASLKIIAGI